MAKRSNEKKSGAIKKMSQNVPMPKSGRSDYKRVHGEILSCIVRLWSRNGRWPTDGEIASELGISRKTVLRHKPDIHLGTFYSELAILAPKILENFTVEVLKDPTPRNVEAWFRLMGQISQATEKAAKPQEENGKE